MTDSQMVFLFWILTSAILTMRATRRTIAKGITIQFTEMLFVFVFWPAIALKALAARRSGG